MQFLQTKQPQTRSAKVVEDGGACWVQEQLPPYPSPVCVLRLFGLERIGCWFLVLEKATLCVNVPSMESEGISSLREKSKKKNEFIKT